MLLLVVVTALLYTSTVQADESISFFFPQGIGEASCIDTNSWTKWFNTRKPSGDPNLDREMLLDIQAANGRDICPTPLGMQADSVGEIPNVDSYTCSWSVMDIIVAGFRSNIPDLDFQVRFCCPNNAFDTTTTTSTTRTTTTPRSMTTGTCGRAEIKHSLKSLRIFGGSRATPNSWPWQVLYEETKACQDDMICLGICGGTLIDSRHVLTASHCIGTTDPSVITITAGLHDQDADEGETRQIRRVERIFKHPDYNPETMENDITILRLSEPVEFNKYVQPACLPGSDPQPDDDVVLIGWGAVRAGESPYHQLKQTKVKVIGDCKRYWGKVDEEKQVCVGDPVSRDSVCSGDSGGPMLYEYNGQWVVAGITSYIAYASCQSNSNFMPNVYVRVSAYLPWITTII